MSTRSTSDSCADSPESAVDPVTIGVGSPAKESCCAPEYSVPTDSSSGSVPAAGAASTSGSVDLRGPSSVACPASLVEVSRPPELSTSVCGAVDSPPWWASRHRRGGAAGAVDGPGGGASASAGGAVAVAPPAPGSGEPSADGALEESVPVSARDAESLPGGHRHPHTECDHQCPDAADVIAGTPGERGRRRHRGEVLGCGAGHQTRGLRLTGASRLAVRALPRPARRFASAAMARPPTARGL